MNVDYNLIKKMFNFKLYRNNKEGRNNKISNHYYTEEDPGGPLCQVDRWTGGPTDPSSSSCWIDYNYY